MDDSILTSVKKMLGMEEDYTAFDLDITVHINSTFSTLQSLGIGPAEGFSITDSTTTWSEFTGIDKALNSVKSYMFMKVKIMFDPPGSSFVLEAYNKNITEMEWRLNAHREEVKYPWTDPLTPTSDITV